MRILVFGDSIVRGSYDEEYGGWTCRLSAAFSKKTIDEKKYYKLYGFGIGGETSGELLQRFQKELVEKQRLNEESVLLFNTGLNDTKNLCGDSKNLIPLEEYEQNVHTILSGAIKAVKQVYFVGLTRVAEFNVGISYEGKKYEFYNKEIEKYDRAVERVCGELNVTYISIGGFDTSKMIMWDGIHPNAEGHRLIFERVKETLKKEGIL